MTFASSSRNGLQFPPSEQPRCAWQSHSAFTQPLISRAVSLLLFGSTGSFCLYFFSCIAVLVRDIVGQQLEWVKKEIKFPRKQKPTRTNTPTKQSNTHKKPNQAKIQGNLQTRWNRWNVRVPLKPLTSSLPPSSIAPRCPCLDVFHINVCTRIPRRVSNIW